MPLLGVHKGFATQQTGHTDAPDSQWVLLAGPLKLAYDCKTFIPSMGRSCSLVCLYLSALEITLGPQVHPTPQPKACALLWGLKRGCD